MGPDLDGRLARSGVEGEARRSRAERLLDQSGGEARSAILVNVAAGPGQDLERLGLIEARAHAPEDLEGGQHNLLALVVGEDAEVDAGVGAGIRTHWNALLAETRERKRPCYSIFASHNSLRRAASILTDLLWTPGLK